MKLWVLHRLKSGIKEFQHSFKDRRFSFESDKHSGITNSRHPEKIEKVQT